MKNTIGHQRINVHSNGIFTCSTTAFVDWCDCGVFVGKCGDVVFDETFYWFYSIVRVCIFHTLVPCMVAVRDITYVHTVPSSFQNKWPKKTVPKPHRLLYILPARWSETLTEIQQHNEFEIFSYHLGAYHLHLICQLKSHCLVMF